MKLEGKCSVGGERYVGWYVELLANIFWLKLEELLLLHLYIIPSKNVTWWCFNVDVLAQVELLPEF